MGARVEHLEQSQAVLAAFEGELARLRESATYTGREIGHLAQGLSSGLRRAFDGLVFDGMRAEEALKGLSKRLVDSFYSAAIRPVSQAAGGAMAQGLAGVMSGLMPFAQGGAFSQGRVMPFAKGGVISSPTAFPMRGATGLMGEAGPEAIMPLTRGVDGRLGVQAQGGRPVTVVMNVTTPDVQGFQRSQSQIAAQLGRALGRGQRNR